MADDGPCAALEALAAAFNPKEFATTLLSSQGRVPCLTVISRPARTSQDVYAQEGWFWHGWAERIAPITDTGTGQAATKIADMLRGTLPPLPAPPRLLPAQPPTPPLSHSNAPVTRPPGPSTQRAARQGGTGHE